MCASGDAKHSCTPSCIKWHSVGSKESASDLEQYSAAACRAEVVLLAQIKTTDRDGACSKYKPGLVYRSALLPAAALEPSSMS